ncbi:MAG: galactose mutarotase [Defluviitaleaceae bacterium]|nr:galactose mutarotase [Defluviitaleaceae bacterium]
MSIKTFEMKNKMGITMKVTNVGCGIISLWVPDKEGKLRDIVHGLDNPEDYGKTQPYFGVVCGRVANRIGNGKFTLDGKEYVLEANDGPHHLHGGVNAFDKKVWTVEEHAIDKVVFSYVSPDGENGYPGKLTVYVTYTLTDDTLRIDYRAETDTKTVSNVTNHSYFNLDGHDAKDVFGHVMQIFSDKMTAVDETLIPTGELADVTGTPFDFRVAKSIGQDFDAVEGGYDHNYALRGPGVAATVYSPVSGISMTVKTNSPGLQFYTGNFLDGTVTGKGVAYQKQSAFCMETQLFPDCVNRPEFPSPVVVVGKPQESYTEFVFSIK